MKACNVSQQFSSKLWNMSKIRWNRKVNKCSQRHLVAEIWKFQNSKMEFFIILTIPENMNALGTTIKPHLKNHARISWMMTHLWSLLHISGTKAYKNIPYPLECNPGVLFFIMGFWVRFYSNLTYLGLYLRWVSIY